MTKFVCTLMFINSTPPQSASMSMIYTYPLNQKKQLHCGEDCRPRFLPANLHHHCHNRGRGEVKMLHIRTVQMVELPAQRQALPHLEKSRTSGLSHHRSRAACEPGRFYKTKGYCSVDKIAGRYGGAYD